MATKLGYYALGMAAAALLISAPASAQKSKDVLRATSEQPISLVDRIHNPQPATTLMTNVIFDSLVAYDSVNRKFRPSLAKSWKRIDDKTLEFKLREDVKFHDGSAFDADDVVHTINYVINPKIKFRFKGSRYGWMKGVEKIDKYTIRVVSKGLFAAALARLDRNLLIYPSDTHAKTTVDFGKAPIGTGPYIARQVDSSKGVILELNKNYALAQPWRPAGKIGKVEIKPISDRQTQQARMLVGDQDIMFNVPNDQAAAMATDPKFKLSVNDTISFSYLQFDSADRGKTGLFANQKVRKALSHAINREAIKKALTPVAAQKIPLPSGMCHKWITGCDFSSPLPAYDPALAKKLLAEAGYKGGFKVVLTAWGAVKDVAEAVAGDLRKVGVKASVDYVTYGTYAKRRTQGKLTALVSYWDNAGGGPDIESTMGFFYLPGTRDYMQDKTLHTNTLEGRKIFDPAKRAAHYAKTFNKVIDKNYLMPIIALPALVVHTKELVLEGGHKSPEGFLYNYMHWAK